MPERDEKDQRVHSKLIAIATSGGVINLALFTVVCDRLVDRIMGTPFDRLRRSSGRRLGRIGRAIFLTDAKHYPVECQSSRLQFLYCKMYILRPCEIYPYSSKDSTRIIPHDSYTSRGEIFAAHGHSHGSFLTGLWL